MKTVIQAILVFIELFEYIIIADVILSWLPLLGIRFRPRFISEIIDPLYNKVRKIIPTRIGYFDFTPIVVILILEIIRMIITNVVTNINII